jgi:DNA-binding IclR family transcriptional regulator
MNLSSTEKLLTILMSFTPHNPGMGNVELSQKLGMNVSTVNRLLQVLVSFNLIRQDSRNRRYSLGRAAADLGRALEQSLSSRLVSIAHPYMEDLRDQIKESVSLEVLKGGYATIATEVLGPPPLSVSFNLGETMPVHVAAGAKAILAFSAPELVARLMTGELKRFTDKTITDADEFKAHLQEVRKQGYALDVGEENIEVHAIGVPVFDYSGKPVAALCLCAPASRMKKLLESGVIPKISVAAEKISSELLFAKDTSSDS